MKVYTGISFLISLGALSSIQVPSFPQFGGGRQHPSILIELLQHLRQESDWHLAVAHCFLWADNSLL